MENEIYKMYDLVFQDMVESYIESNYENENISKEDIAYIASKVSDNDYLWEVIHEVIHVYLEDFLKEEK